jgi:hypothetical protein
MMLGTTRVWFRYKGPGRIVSPTEVTSRVDPSPTMMEKEKVGLWGWGKETIMGSGVVWCQAPESATQSVGGEGGDDMGMGKESHQRHPHRATGRGVGPAVASMLTGVVWCQAPESATQSVGGVGGDDMGMGKESHQRHPHRATGRGAGAGSGEHADGDHK